MSLNTEEPWTGAMINMLRVLINDNAYEGTYTYSDPRLREILTVAAMYVAQEITFQTTYTIDVVASTISPDPYTKGDKVFMNLTVLKGACIIDQGTFRQRAFTSGLEAKCGPATMKTLKHLDGFKDLIELGPCGMYEKLKEEEQFGGESLNSVIYFILSPFVSDTFDPVCSFSPQSDSDRMFR